MDADIFTLDQLQLGGKAIVTKLNSGAKIKRRLLDLGFTPGAVTEAVLLSPGKDPTAYLIRGTVIALRSEDARVVFCCAGDRAI